MHRMTLRRRLYGMPEDGALDLFVGTLAIHQICVHVGYMLDCNRTEFTRRPLVRKE